MRKITILIFAFTFPSLALAAVDCELRPDHPKCQPPSGGGGELMVYDADDVPVGPFISAGADDVSRGVFRYEFDYQGLKEVAHLFVSRNSIRSKFFGVTVYYTDANCLTEPWIEHEPSYVCSATIRMAGLTTIILAGWV